MFFLPFYSIISSSLIIFSTLIFSAFFYFAPAPYSHFSNFFISSLFLSHPDT